MSASDDRPMSACDLTALGPGQRRDHQELTERLLNQRVQEVVDRPGGCALRFAADDYAAITSFVEHERRCCPFLRFVLGVTPEGGPIWLEISGPDGAMEVFRAAVGWHGR
jgi:hypothetical protein